MNTTRVITSIAITAGLLLAGLGVYAGYDAPDAADFTPMTIPYQGVLERDGGLVSGTAHFRLGLWSAESGGNQLWGPETHLNAVVQDGRFALTIGSITALSHAHLENKPVFLQVEVQVVDVDPDFTELAGRQQLHSSPYAIRAYRAMYSETAAAVDSLTDHNIYTSTGNVGVGRIPTTGASLEIGGGGGSNIELLVDGRIKSSGSAAGMWMSDNAFVGLNGTKVGLWNNGSWRFTVDSDGSTSVGGNLAVSGTVKGKNLTLGCQHKTTTIPGGDDNTGSVSCSAGYTLTGCGCHSLTQCDGTSVNSALTTCTGHNSSNLEATVWGICCRVE